MGENTRTALIGIIVEDAGSVEELNQLLHQYRDYIIGRMGIPHLRNPFPSSASQWKRIRTR